MWEGAYLTDSDAQVFSTKYRVAEFELADSWDGPYQGGDFGFAQDPTAAVRCHVHDDVLYVSHEAGRTGLELDDTAPFITSRIPELADYATRWDNSRPESIRHLNEMMLYSYKVDRLTGDILPVIVDAHNHYIDALRYAVGPMIKRGGQAVMFLTKRYR